MTHPIRAILAVSTVCLLLLGIGPSPAVAQDAYTIKRSFKAGEVDRYKNTFEVEAANGMKLQVVFMTTEKTNEIKADGTMVRSITVDAAEIVVNGQSMPMPNFRTVTMTATLDKDGKPVKEEGEGGQFRQMLSMTRPPAEADRPLKVGEEWKTEVPTNKDGTKKLNVVVTLVGLENKSDTVPVDTYKVKTVAEGVVESPQGDQRVKLESVSLVARDTGKPFKSEGTITGLTLPQFGAAKITFKLLHQPDGEKKDEKKGEG